MITCMTIHDLMELIYAMIYHLNTGRLDDIGNIVRGRVLAQSDLRAADAVHVYHRGCYKRFLKDLSMSKGSVLN